MSKTPVTYKETLQGALEVHEIEKIIMDNLIKTQKFLFRNYKKLDISEKTVRRLHKILTASLFEEAGTYRTHDVTLGDFEPPSFFEVSQHMANWEKDYTERCKHARTRDEKKELCAWLIHRFLWIHPFFDYNGRVARLLGELSLLKNGFPVVTFKATKRADFVKAVKEATKTGDLNLLEQFIKNG